MSVRDDAEQMLGQMAELLDQGWCQGTYCQTSPEGQRQRCLQGALFFVGNLKEAYPVVDAVVHAIHGEIGWHSLIFWNDHVAQTKEEVVAMVCNAKRNLKETP